MAGSASKAGSANKAQSANKAIAQNDFSLPVILHGPSARFANIAFQVAVESNTLDAVTKDLKVLYSRV
jgi:hypothetical protein